MSTEIPRNEDGKTEDELWASLEGQIGTERASTLLDLADMINTRGDFDRGLSLADAALESATDADNELVMGKAHIMRGVTLFALDRFEESAAAHLDGARLFERFDSTAEISGAYFNASWSLECAGILDRALECADTAILTAQQEEEDQAIARANVQRADVLEKLGGRSDEVMQALSAARQSFRSASDTRAVMHIDTRVADLFADAGDYKAAISLLTDCLSVAESLDESTAAYYAYRLAGVQRRQGLFAEALAMLQRPLKHNLENDAIQPLAATYQEMAICQWRLDENDEAFRLISKARAHYDMVGSDSGVRECDEARASWMHGMGRYTEAIEINRLLVETTEGWGHFMARARLADNYRCSGESDKALGLSTPEDSEDASMMGKGNWFWRECIRAMTLQGLDRPEDAQEIATRCLEMDMSSASAFVQARFHEMRGDAKDVADNEDGAHADWARAVAFYLVADMPGEARRLSAEFLPSTGEDQGQ